MRSRKGHEDFQVDLRSTGPHVQREQLKRIVAKREDSGRFFLAAGRFAGRHFWSLCAAGLGVVCSG